MVHSNEDIKYCESLLESFYGIGCGLEGGVTRLGYTKDEDLMHEAFQKLGDKLECVSFADEVGNTYVANNKKENYYLIGSHLDSVIEGGRYDGVAGIIAGLLVLKWAKEEGLNVPIRVGAFRCEESSNFGCCTIGSGLVTKEATKQEIDGLVGRDGRTLGEVFEDYGYTLKPQKISGIKEYLEMHIEQGKILEEYKTDIGVVFTVAGPIRYHLHLHGIAEHSGTTPMMMRNDALCAAAEIILEVERIGNRESFCQSVATIGVIENQPNALNVVPGAVKLGVDMRGVDSASLERMERSMLEAAKTICSKRGISLMEEKIGSISPIEMSKDVQARIENAGKELGLSTRMMVSGAGHDAMSFAGLCDTGMVFIPCNKGISHNKMEFTTIENICNGARVLYECIRKENI